MKVYGSQNKHIASFDIKSVPTKNSGVCCTSNPVSLLWVGGCGCGGGGYTWPLGFRAVLTLYTTNKYKMWSPMLLKGWTLTLNIIHNGPDPALGLLHI